MARVGRGRRIAAALVLLVCTACGSEPPIQPTPVLSLTCPARVDASSTDGRPVSVPIATPQAIGGSAPVAVTCNQPGQFPVGNTTVGCTATDARSQTATCSIVVAVKGPPRLRYTRFLAFGDSITAGQESAPVTLRLIPSPWAYTVVLQNRLAARYTLQTPVVLNEGQGGEFTSGGLLRLPPLLLQYQPEVLLLMEGTNDLLDRPDIARGADTAIANLRQMIAFAKALRMQVALATIPPQRAGGVRRRDAVAAIIPAFNDRVRALAASEGVVLVDVHAAMRDNLNLIGVDDLHPTVLGFSVIADTFYEAILRSYEETTTLDRTIR